MEKESNAIYLFESETSRVVYLTTRISLYPTGELIAD